MNFETKLSSTLSKISNSSQECLIMGDVNVDFLTNVNKDFKHILLLYGFKQLIEKPTRITDKGESLIDIIATNNASVISKSGVISLSFSDHEMVGCTRKMNNLKFEQKTIYCRDYRNYDPIKMNDDLRKVNWEPIYLMTNVNDAWSFLKILLSNTFDKHAPMITKHIRGKPCPWLSEEIKAQMNVRDQLYRKWKKSKTPANKKNYREKRNIVNIMIRSAKSHHSKDLLRESANDCNKFWKSIKNIYPCKGKKSTNSPSFVINGIETDNKQKIVNGFCSFFCHYRQ